MRFTELNDLESEPGDAFIEKEHDAAEWSGILTDHPHGRRDALERELELKQPGFDIVSGAHVDSSVEESPRSVLASVPPVKRQTEVCARVIWVNDRESVPLAVNACERW